MKFLSQVYTIARGSVGGITYTANQYHQLIARARTSPVNPGSSLQTAIRSAFSGAETLWKALTDTQRQNWQQYASMTPRQNPLGPITLTGRAFMRGVIALREYMAAELGVVFTDDDTAPMTPGMLNLTGVKAIAPGAGITGCAITWTNPLGNPAIFNLVQISQAFEPTRNFFKGPWDTPKNEGATTAAGAAGIQEFVGLEVDKAYFMRVRGIIEVGPHKISEDFIVRMIAVTVPV